MALQDQGAWRREGSWACFAADFRDSAPWYFRTLESWWQLFAPHRLRLIEPCEPLHPQTRQPASIILIAQHCATQDITQSFK